MTEEMTALREPTPTEAPAGAERPARKPATPKKARPKGIGMPNDPVADLLTRVRNAAVARHETVSIPTSRMKAEVARILIMLKQGGSSIILVERNTWFSTDRWKR